MVEELASTARELQDMIQTTQSFKEKKQKWVDPPRGLEVEHLKATHMTHMPVNMRLAESFIFDVVVIPQIPEGKEDTDERVWLGEVVRKVNYKSGVTKSEPPCIYIY